ncbi:hypothetical protein HY949_00530 [Candidatus Gottesmanbacteria bacterium]|nr:hypothetical protein [Candidatus Gottesmanbacteria bacterium]
MSRFDKEANGSLDSARQPWNNEGAMKKKPVSNSFIYFFGSVLLIITAIIATAILNTTNNSGASQDVRARASVTSLMRMTAVVQSVDETSGVVVVAGLQFSGSTPEGLQNVARNSGGSWSVRVSGSINLASIGPGSRIELQINPSTFNIADHTLTAAAITLSR